LKEEALEGAALEEATDLS